MAGRFSIETVFGAVDRISKPVKKMRQNTRNFTRTARRGFKKLNKSVDKFAQGLKKSAMVATAAFAIMSAGMLNVINVGAQFEKTVVGAAAKFPGEIRRGSEAYADLEDAARKAGATTEFSASQAAEGLNFLAMAGFNAEQAIAALPGVVDLATASTVELSEASDIASDTLSAFGLMTKDATKLTTNLTRVNDVLAKTTTTANTDMTALFETIKKGGAQATASGASIETFSAIAGVLANNAVKGSEAGSTMKNMFLRLSAPTAQASKLIKKYAGDVVDSSGNLKDIIGIMGSLEKGLDGLGTAEKAGVLNTIFGSRAITGVNILLKEGGKNLEAYRKQLEASTGASKTMASTMRDTTQGSIDSLSSAFEGLKITMFLLNNTAIRAFVDSITAMVRRVDGMIKTNQEFGRTFTKDLINTMLAAIKLIGILVGAIIAWKVAMVALNVVVAITNGLFMAAKGIIIAFTLVTKILTFVINAAKIAVALFNFVLWANPIGAIIGLIVLLAGAFALLIANWDDVSAFISDFWDGIVNTFESAIAIISSLIESVMNPLSTLIGGAIKIKQAIGFDDVPDVDGVDARANNSAVDSAVVTSSEQISKSFEERRDTLGIQIEDKTNSAKVVKDPSFGSTTVSMQSTGAF